MKLRDISIKIERKGDEKIFCKGNHKKTKTTYGMEGNICTRCD